MRQFRNFEREGLSLLEIGRSRRAAVFVVFRDEIFQLRNDFEIVFVVFGLDFRWLKFKGYLKVRDDVINR